MLCIYFTVRYTISYRKRWLSHSWWKTMFRCFLWSAIIHENMNILSMYTRIKQLIQSRKIAVFRCWNIDGALQSPIWITWLLKVPSTVANTILTTWSGWISICLYVPAAPWVHMFKCIVHAGPVGPSLCVGLHMGLGLHSATVLTHGINTRLSFITTALLCFKFPI